VSSKDEVFTRLTNEILELQAGIMEQKEAECQNIIYNKYLKMRIFKKLRTRVM